jgi:hypothetical protein
MRYPVVLPFITKQAKVLFNFLVLAFHFAVTLKMVGSSETGLNTKILVEGSHETGSELRAMIGEDLLWDSMKAKYIGVMDVSGTLCYNGRILFFPFSFHSIIFQNVPLGSLLFFPRLTHCFVSF